MTLWDFDKFQLTKMGPAVGSALTAQLKRSASVFSGASGGFQAGDWS